VGRHSRFAKGLSCSYRNWPSRNIFFVFPFDGEDIVLGIKWLDNLGNMKKVQIQNQGDPTLCKGNISTRTIIKELQDEEEESIIECDTKSKFRGGQVSKEVQTRLQEIDVF